MRGAWEMCLETDAGTRLLGSSVRILGCPRPAESDIPPTPQLTAAPLHSPLLLPDPRAPGWRFSAPVPSRPGGCRRLPGDLFGLTFCPSRAGCGSSVVRNTSCTGGHLGACGQPHHERLQGGLQAGKEDSPGKFHD